ncbi:MAG: hypothetical protein NZM37_09485 [Sandaracinaceae bacterium]|nr:hypothetical protein [Sandaracinaceae bacterium]MDW8245367.1 nucleoside transporter C-terminal domain-containing protein [Sandaracinaceae bacterium]
MPNAFPYGEQLRSFLGLISVFAIAWLFSLDRRAFPWRVVFYGTGIQVLFGLFVLRTQAGSAIFLHLNDGVVRLLQFTTEGSRFLFGSYIDRDFTFALHVLPTIVFFSSLSAILYHLGLMQVVVRGVAWLMQRTLGTSGAETLSAAANIFVGQTEAPLLIRPYVAQMTESELASVMVGGFATVAGGVMAAYVGMLSPHFPHIAGHLIAASVMSAPAALVISKILVPEKGIPETLGKLPKDLPTPYVNLIDAAATGAADGLRLALNVGAMLLAFVALISFTDFLLTLPSHLYNRWAWAKAVVALQAKGLALPQGCASQSNSIDASLLIGCIEKASELLGDTSLRAWPEITLERILAWIDWPIAILLGVPIEDSEKVAAILGKRIVLNEFVAYVDLARNLESSHPISHRAATITTYALCGFANFGSIAIQIGGIGTIAPSRRKDLARLGLRAMLGGLLASYATACVAGIFI